MSAILEDHGKLLKNSLPPDAIHFKEHSDYVRYVHHYLTLEALIMPAVDANHACSVVGKCLATDACLTADPGVASSIPARSHTFVETDHEIISTVILLPLAESFKKGCCQLQAKVCARITG